MISLIRKFCMSTEKTVVLNTNRGIMSTSICEIRVHDSLWRRARLLLPTVDGKLLKDSHMIDIEEDSKELDTDVGHLERSYDEYVSEENYKKKMLRRILTKKKMFKRPKEPNMLTFSEREHIKFLHKSDPNEWTVERLSESFPALPYAIKKILKNKWKPEDLESVKTFDAKVLENWEKLKRDELEASPDVLNHVKKFINKYDNLKVQLENTKFFPEPDVPKKVSWGNGPLTALMLKYEKDIEMLKSRHFEKIGLIHEGDKEKAVVAVNEEQVNTIEENIKNNLEMRDINNDSFMIGKPKMRDREMTLDDLKREILEKTEKENKPLSKFEEALLDKTLQRDRRSEKVSVEGKSNDSNNAINECHSRMKREEKRKKSNDFIKEVMKEKVYNESTPEGEWLESPPQSEDNDLRVDDRIHTIKETDVGRFLAKLRGEELKTKIEEQKPPEKAAKKPVQFYGTEKDKEMVERDCELLSGSAFWGSSNQPRKKSEDTASLEMFSVNTKTSPHLSPTLKTYFSYNYPDRVEIPKDKWTKGMTYRIKDCYYDDDGEFLYRVPGITQD